MIKLVLSDMDNTLIHLGDLCVSDRALRAIDNLQKAGVHFAPCTGRTPEELAGLFRNGLEIVQTFVASNGAEIYLDGELVGERYLQHDQLLALTEDVRHYPGCGVLVFDGLTARAIGFTEDEVARIQALVSVKVFSADELGDSPVIKAGCTVAPEFKDELVPRYKELFDAFEMVEPTPCWYDLLPRGMNKAVGAQILMESMHISPDEVLVFGDAENDLEMLTYFDNAVVVANASEDARACAKYQIGFCADEAVPEALEELTCAIKEKRQPKFLTDAYKIKR